MSFVTFTVMISRLDSWTHRCMSSSPAIDFRIASCSLFPSPRIAYCYIWRVKIKVLYYCIVYIIIDDNGDVCPMQTYKNSQTRKTYTHTPNILVYKHTHTQTHAHMHASMRSRAHTYTHTHTHTDTHMHTKIHTGIAIRLYLYLYSMKCLTFYALKI